jgi:hypothetical protein
MAIMRAGMLMERPGWIGVTLAINPLVVTAGYFRHGLQVSGKGMASSILMVSTMCSLIL